MFQLLGKFPAGFVQKMMKNGGSPIVVSNTPWAKSRVTLMGDEVEDIGGWIPLLAYSGVGFLIIRYSETLRICGVAEEACLKEEQLKFFLNELENEIKLISEEVAAAKKKNPHSLVIKIDE
ncbi:unnamed protein product [Allacma fusca]|uniref:O-acyltransferase WSD1 C-terminal domain-containing protein n=1 Tax=Allacma fusca TaxID=39272 RepID=A0A8J2KPQ7_9HEXA|nr:unnamed protein product [Allacma fusca]